MLIIKIQKLMKDIESSFWNISTNNEGGTIMNESAPSHYLKGLKEELEILTMRIIGANDDPEIASINVDMKDYPLMQKSIILIGPNTVMKWLKEEISKEMEHKRITDAKRQDNKNTSEMIDMVKNKKCRQSLEINPTHGTSVTWEKGVEKEG